MRNIFFILCVLLLVEGVSGDVKVMKGDSVTLKAGGIEIQTGDLILWKFNNDIIIKMKKTDQVSTSDDVLDERFRDRLKLDQTGSLTITNTTTTDSGLYQLEIKSSKVIPKNYTVTVRDASGVDTHGLKSVSVMKGDTVPLFAGVAEIQKNDQIQLWKCGNPDVLIANLSGYVDMNMNIHLADKTGQLDIINIQSNQAGDYRVEVNTSSMILHRKFRIAVRGVFGVEKEEVPVSVMEGDSVTLNPSTEISEDDTILWLFGKESIAVMIKADGLFSTSDGEVVGFKDRLELDPQTGSLTITNIRTTDSGLYKLQIRSRIKISQNFSVTVCGEMKTVPVTEGEPIILHTGVDIQGYDLILWKFGDHLISEINKSANQFLPHDTSDERFKDRLQPNRESGDLTINGSKTTDSGDYHLNMISSSHSLQRTISVTVGSGLSPGAVVAWIVVAVVLLLVLVAVVICYHRKICKLKGRGDLVKNGTNDPLKTGTDGSDNL